MKSFLINICLLLLAIAATAFGAHGQIKTLKINSSILNEDVEVWVTTPPEYSKTTTSFPVLYVLDADGLFNLASDMNAYLSLKYVEHMPAMIVVGVRSKSGTWRSKYFNPPDSASKDQYQADYFQQFLEKELKPEITKNFRTADFSLLVGHSLGGLFVTYSLASRPNVFNGYIAISPTLHRHLPQLTKKIKALTLTKPTFYYFSVAEHDLNNYLPATEKLRDSVTHYAVPNLEWAYSFSKSKDHYTTAPVVLFEQLDAIFKPWYLSDPVKPITLDWMLQHVEVLNKRYAYDINIESRLATFGQALLANERLESAKRTFDALLQRYPLSPIPHQCLTDYYISVQDKSKARHHNDEAIKIMRSIKSPDLNAAIVLKAVIDKM
ncbi:MAG: hypothetical protein J0L67_20995 [Cytophagales bacterium]|jgi:uncharacterized protein|nr:hypothetical protein [Cytophagales bacterium]